MDFDTAVNMLVQASLGPWPDRSASVELIVAVLAPKFAMLSEDRIGTAVRHTIAAQGGNDRPLRPVRSLAFRGAPASSKAAFFITGPLAAMSLNM